MIGALLVLGLSLPASPADPAEAGQGDRAAAKSAFERAQQHYSLGEFEAALAHFRAAYQAAPHPDLLFNIAQCHRNLGESARAIFFFERYLSERPHATDAEQVRLLLDELRAHAPLPVSLPTPPPAETASAASAVSIEPLQMPPPAPAPASDKSIAGEWWFWTAILLGAAAIAGATALAVRSSGSDLPEDPIATFNYRDL
jgi:tetratricopeptide (TPR) repeat protein